MMYSFTNIDLTSVFMCFDDQDPPADLESNHIPSFSESKGCKIYSPPARYCGSVEKNYLDGVSLRCRRCRPCKICIILNPRSKILIQSFPQNSWISIHSFPTRLLFLEIPDRRTVSVLHLERQIPKNTFCWNRAIFFLYVLQNNFLQIGTEKKTDLMVQRCSKSLFWPWETYENCDISSGPFPFSDTNDLPCGDSDTRSTPLRARAFDEEPQAFGDGFV